MYRLLLIAMLFLAGCGSPKPYVVDPTQGMTVIPQVQGKSFLVLQRGYAAAAELSDLAKVQDTKAENTKATSTATGMIKDDVKGRALFPDLWDKLVLYKQLNSTLEMAGGITDLAIYKSGNDLLFAANNYDVIVFDDWYINGGVEYADFEALGLRYLVSDLATLAQELPASQTFGASADQGFAPTDITALGVNPIGGIDGIDGSVFA